MTPFRTPTWVSCWCRCNTDRFGWRRRLRVIRVADTDSRCRGRLFLFIIFTTIDRVVRGWSYKPDVIHTFNITSKNFNRSRDLHKVYDIHRNELQSMHRIGEPTLNWLDSRIKRDWSHCLGNLSNLNFPLIMPSVPFDTSFLMMNDTND